MKLLKNCIQSEFAKGKNAPDSLFINVSPVLSSEDDCTCPYTVYFNIRDVKADSIYISCWLYSGVASFKDSSEVKVEISRESVRLDDGSRYYLYKPCMQAMLYSVNVEDKDEYQIPSAITYNGEEYSVVSFYHGSIYSKDIKKLVFPKSIQRIDEDNADFKNGIFAPKLENIEVEPGSRLMSSVDGVLYDAKHKSLWCCPVASDRTEYTVIDGVEKICQYAFYNCSNLKSIRLPESVTIIKTCAFAGCKTSRPGSFLRRRTDRGRGRPGCRTSSAASARRRPARRRCGSPPASSGRRRAASDRGSSRG